MALVQTTMRLLTAFGMGGCTDRQRDEDAQNVEAPDGKCLVSPTSITSTFKRSSGKAVGVAPTPSTCTPLSSPSSSVFEVSSSLRSLPGSERRLSTPLTRNGVARLTQGHWLLQYERAAYDPLDLELLATLLDYTKISSSVSGQKHATLLVKMMRFLHSLGHGLDEICCHLAHAACYFRSIYSVCGSAMSSEEIANVLVLLVYLAHCYVQDETCQLRIWHKYLFKSYCKLGTLNKATVQLMKRLNYVLRVPDEDLRQALSEFMQVLPPPSKEEERWHGLWQMSNDF